MLLVEGVLLQLNRPVLRLVLQYSVGLAWREICQLLSLMAVGSWVQVHCVDGVSVEGYGMMCTLQWVLEERSRTSVWA